MFSLRAEIKIPKHAKNYSKTTLKLLYAKNGSEWHLTLEKWQVFEKWEIRPLCKGLCKMVNLGVQIQLPKTCEKRLYNHVRVVLCKKKNIQDTLNLKNNTILKIGKIGVEAKAIALSECLVWV